MGRGRVKFWAPKVSPIWADPYGSATLKAWHDLGSCGGVLVAPADKVDPHIAFFSLFFVLFVSLVVHCQDLGLAPPLGEFVIDSHLERECVCLCQCVCVGEREQERVRERERERAIEREREGERERAIEREREREGNPAPSLSDSTRRRREGCGRLLDHASSDSRVIKQGTEEEKKKKKKNMGMRRAT